MDMTGNLGDKVIAAEQDVMNKLAPVEQALIELVRIIKTGVDIVFTISVTPKKEKVNG